MNNGRDCPHGRQVGKCDTCDLITAELQLEKVTAERDALAAQVEVLRGKSKALIEQAERVLYYDIENYLALKGFAYALDKALDATPAACLAKVQAEAGRAGYYEALQSHSDRTTRDEDVELADQYARRLLQGGAQ